MRHAAAARAAAPPAPAPAAANHQAVADGRGRRRTSAIHRLAHLRAVALVPSATQGRSNAVSVRRGCGARRPPSRRASSPKIRAAVDRRHQRGGVGRTRLVRGRRRCRCARSARGDGRLLVASAACGIRGRTRRAAVRAPGGAQPGSCCPAHGQRPSCRCFRRPPPRCASPGSAMGPAPAAGQPFPASASPPSDSTANSAYSSTVSHSP